jgi:hypothetical protein
MDIDNDFISDIENDNILQLSIYQGIFVPLLIYIIGKMINYFNNYIS